MGVGGPKDFVTLVNRFPPHGQWITSVLSNRFVTASARFAGWDRRSGVIHSRLSANSRTKPPYLSSIK